MRNVASLALFNVTIAGTNMNYKNPGIQLSLFEQVFRNHEMHPVGQFIKKYSSSNNEDILSIGIVDALSDANVNFFRSGNYKMIPLGC